MNTPFLSNRGRRGRRRSRGQALVEFALVIPIFLLLLCGVLDFGFLLYGRMTIINAAREGARAGITSATPSDIPADVQRAVTAAASGLNSADLTVPTPTCINDVLPGTCVFSDPPAANAASAGDSVKVRVNYRYHPFFPLLFGASIDLSSSVQMVLE